MERRGEHQSPAGATAAGISVRDGLMSTRMLILAALACGLVILGAFTVQVLSAL